jgi:hypothetical protein
MNTGEALTKAVDEVYRLQSLIGRYIMHVEDEEGCDFLDEWRLENITPEEADELRRHAEVTREGVGA